MPPAVNAVCTPTFWQSGLLLSMLLLLLRYTSGAMAPHPPSSLLVAASET